MGNLTAKNRDCLWGSVLGGACMTLLGVCMALPLYLYYADIISVEIPFLVIVVGYGDVMTWLYMAVMICAIFSTAITNAYAFIQWMHSRFGINKNKLALILCAVGVPAAHIGFSNIVGSVYPVFGLIGFFQIIIILLSWRLRKKSQTK
jgi:uncharacterized membrane protein YkvI